MAEFGENLRRIREERGMTQQMLADHLFITRQAVSRWEGGSRYPDLMTTKKMSQYLEVSIDELLADEDMASYAEKNAILETSVSRGVQTTILSFVFICYLILSIWNFFEIGTIGGQDVIIIMQMLIEPFKSVMLAAVLGYGIVMSIRNELNPKMVTLFSVIFFGAAVVTGIIGVVIEPSTEIGILIVMTILNLVILIIVALFFGKGKINNPVPVYIVAVVYGVGGFLNFILGMPMDLEYYAQKYLLSTSLVGTLGGELLMCLICYMAYELHRKRKRATITTK